MEKTKEEFKQVELTIPLKWEEVTVEQFQKLQVLNKDDYKSDLLYMVDVISVLANSTADIIHNIDFGSLNMLIEQMIFVQTPISNKKKEIVSIGEEKYKWIGDFNSINVGEAISIEQIIDLEELSFTMSFDVVLAVLLRKVKEDGTLEEFDAKKFEEHRELFSKIPITDVYGMIIFFSLGERPSMKNMLGSLVAGLWKKMKKNIHLKRLKSKRK